MAAELPIPIQPVGKLPGLLLSDILILVGVGLAIAIALVVWAVFIRKPKDDKSRPDFPPPVAQAKDRRKRRRKRRRREHRTRNPSLADTGGLPSPDHGVGGTTPQP